MWTTYTIPLTRVTLQVRQCGCLLCNIVKHLPGKNLFHLRRLRISLFPDKLAVRKQRCATSSDGLTSTILPYSPLHNSNEATSTSTCINVVDTVPFSLVLPYPMTVVVVPSSGNIGSKFNCCKGMPDVRFESFTNIYETKRED